jgi:hypothetical protein
MTNLERRNRAQRVLQKLEDDIYRNGDDRDNLTDLLTDLRHYCAHDDCAFSFEYCVARSWDHFDAEREDE